MTLKDFTVRNVADDVRLGICSFDSVKGVSPRDCERMAVGALVSEMLDVPSIEIGHNEQGKPLLEGWNISVSHTRGYAAVMMSKAHQVGVDIEYRSDRVSRIVHRFMRQDEVAATVEEHLAVWCAKEAVFKLFSDDRLTFQEMRVTRREDRTLDAENLKRGQSVRVYVETTGQYVLTFTFI